MISYRFGVVTGALLVLAACGGVSSADDVGRSEQSLSSAATVLGFESAADWNVSAGSKSTTTDHTQGSQALAVSNVQYVELVSAPLSTLSDVGSKLLVDLKTPVSPAWGQLQLFASIPSRGVYNQYCGQLSLAGKTANSFSTLSFDLPPALVTALKTSYSDLTFKLALNVPRAAGSYTFDNLRFPNTGPSKVTLRMSSVSDFIAVSVDGIHRRYFRPQDPDQGRTLDVTDWFVRGENTLKMTAIDSDYSSPYSFELWVDDQPALNYTCAADVCSSDGPTRGIVDPRSFVVNTPRLPPAQTVEVTGRQGGKLYLNDTYTGLTTPTTLNLPPGNYTLGLGVSTDGPTTYTGEFYEEAIAVGSSPVQVTFDDNAPLSPQHQIRIGILPIKNTYNYSRTLNRADASNNGVLTDDDVARFKSKLEATRDQWFKPFSYNLGDWSIEELPVEETPFYETTPDGMDTGRFRRETNVDSYSEYDMIVLLFSQYREDGSDVEDGLGILWAFDSRYIGYSNTWGNPTGPDEGLLHEILHNYEGINRTVRGQYNGVDGLHGSRQHGYQFNANGENDFLSFYRPFVRGQVVEAAGMNQNSNLPSPVSSGDLFVGVFPTIRRGITP